MRWSEVVSLVVKVKVEANIAFAVDISVIVPVVAVVVLIVIAVVVIIVVASAVVVIVEDCLDYTIKICFRTVFFSPLSARFVSLVCQENDVAKLVYLL